MGHSAYNLCNVSIRNLSNLDKNSCERLITDVKCICALKNMNNKESPDSNGITVDFYNLIWNDVEEFYINSIYNHSFHTGSLTDLQKVELHSFLSKIRI